MADDGMRVILDEMSYTQVYAKLTGLSEFEKEGIMDRALKEGARVIARQGRANLKARNKMHTGKLLKAVTVWSKKKRGKAYGGFLRNGDITKPIKSWGGSAAHLVDRGTKERYTKKGYYRGSVSKGNPQTGSRFWYDAFEQKKNDAAQKVMKTVDDCMRLIMNK